MKKIFTLILALVIMCSLVACIDDGGSNSTGTSKPTNSTNPTADNSNTTQPPESSETPATSEPTQAPSGNKLVGYWTYVNPSDQAFDSAFNPIFATSYHYYLFNEDGSFEYTKLIQNFKHEVNGKYSVADGKVSFTQVKRVISDNDYVDIADTPMEFEFGNDSDGKYLIIASVYERGGLEYVEINLGSKYREGVRP